MSSKTIVTACDHKFVRGTYLLLLSLRRQGIQLPVHVVTHHLSEVDCALLHQIGGVKLFPTPDNSNHRNIVYQKTAAILTADTDLILWIDSDCIVTGDITPRIETTGEGLPIRLSVVRKIIGGIFFPVSYLLRMALTLFVLASVLSVVSNHWKLLEMFETRWLNVVTLFGIGALYGLLFLVCIRIFRLVKEEDISDFRALDIKKLNFVFDLLSPRKNG